MGVNPRWLGPWGLLRQSIQRLRRGSGPNWTGQIEAVVADLEQMNRSTEADFLAISGKLMSLLSAARTIAAETRAITESISGETGNSACQALMSILDGAGQMEKHATAANELTGIRDSVARIRRSLAGFARVGPSFHAMATLAQIETAHLGSAGLDLCHLAEEFRLAGGDIQFRVEYILEGAAALERRIESTSKDASEFDERSLQALPALVAAAERGLTGFRERQEQSALTVKHLACQSDLLAKAIADIVGSIQFHDITRQQVEHVMDSLSQLCGSSRSKRPPAGAAVVINLQLAQLANAAAAFVDAVRQIDHRLQSATGQVHAMVAESGTLLGPPDRQEVSFYSQMESCFRAVAETDASCKSLAQRTRGALLELQHTLETLRQSAGEIHSVELRLRWLATNAAISAAHIGAAGEPLAAVAAAMHQLLAGCEASSRETDTALHSMASTVRSAMEDSTGSDVAAGDALFHQLRTKIEEFHTLNDTATGRTRQIARIASELSGDVQALREGISAGQVFASTTENCCQTLRGIKAQAASRDGSIEHDALVRFKQRYTMRAERDIHEAVVTSAPPPGAATPAAAPAVSTEFGENVELF